MSELQHKAGKAHWDSVWKETAIANAADPKLPGPRNLLVRRMNELFHILLANQHRGQTLLELGCGASVWLPYFAKEFGFGVAGIDYSQRGCTLSEEILSKAGVTAKVWNGDFFDPPSELVGRFDIVYSAGVAEHFSPTEDCIAAFSKFLAPGGLLLTLVPNMTGTVGWVQRKLDRDVFDIHVPLSKDALRQAHCRAGLTVEWSDYFLSAGFGIVNTSALDPAKASTKVKKAIAKGLGSLSTATWLLEDISVRLPETQAFSQFVVCAARRP